MHVALHESKQKTADHGHDSPYVSSLLMLSQKSQQEIREIPLHECKSDIGSSRKYIFLKSYRIQCPCCSQKNRHHKWTSMMFQYMKHPKDNGKCRTRKDKVKHHRK